jgi:hypothetical protein
MTVHELSQLVLEWIWAGPKPLQKRVRAERRCGRCSEIRHNSRTCKIEIGDADNSNASKKYYPIKYSIAICCGIALRCCACAALVFGGAHL